MGERKYSVYEIDRMRYAVKWLVNIGGRADEIARIHEEHLRTYMLNGTDPDELERRVEETVPNVGKLNQWSGYPKPISTPLGE